MTLSRACPIAACVALAIASALPLQSQPRPVLRARTGDAGAAIVLGLPAAETLSRPDTSGMTLSLPEVWARDAATGALYRTDHVLVRFRESSSPGLRTTALATAGASGSARALWDGWERAAVDLGTSADAVRARLAADPAVGEVMLDYRMEAFATRPNDEFFGRQWNFEALDLPRAWDINDGASDQVVVAVIDTGLNVQGGTFTWRIGGIGTIALPFAEAADLMSPGRIVGARDFVYGDDVPLDLTGHGTHVAGTIAQLTGNGVGVAGIAHRVRVMPI